MRPLLPKEFLRKFPKRSVLAGVQKQCAAIAKRPGVVATIASIGLHGGLALSIPRLLPNTATEDAVIALETDVVALSPSDLAAFSEMATARSPRSSNRQYTDLNGQTLPNLSALRDSLQDSDASTSLDSLDSADSSTSSGSSFGWGSASSYYDWSDRGSSDSGYDSDYDSGSTYTYDAAREDEFYQYWQRSQDLLDRFSEGSATVGEDPGRGAGGDDAKAIAGADAGGTDIDSEANAGGGFDSGAPYTTGMAARESYAIWAIATQDENGLSDDDLSPVFIPVSIPIPITAGASSLIGEQGIVGLLVSPDGQPDSADLLSSFSSNELAKNLVREFVLSGFEGCNVGLPGETWTACGLDITFVAAGSVAATGDDRDPNSQDPNSQDPNSQDPNSIAGIDANAGDPAGPSNDPDTSNPVSFSATTGDELLALMDQFAPETPIAIALNEANPVYQNWHDQLAGILGDAADKLVFRAAPSVLSYPADLDPAFDRNQPTTAIISLAVNPDLSVIPETVAVLRSSGSDQLDAIALGFAETTPRDWYVNNLELNGDRGAIVVFSLSFIESEGDATAPIETDPAALDLENLENDDNPEMQPGETQPDETQPSESQPDEMRPDKSQPSLQPDEMQSDEIQPDELPDTATDEAGAIVNP